MSAVLLEAHELTKHFPVTYGLFHRKLAGVVKAVDGISFTLRWGETFAMVGESGCGKTTLANLVLGLLAPTSGEIYLRGQALSHLSAAGFREYRRFVSAVFQDPYGTLNPRLRVGEIIAEPLAIHGYARATRQRRLHEVLRAVGLPTDSARHFPHEFSGGQRQRLGIARALALKPALMVLDEPVSSLDVSIRSQILNLLKDLQGERGMAYLLISHDLGTVVHMSDWIGVMYLGKLVEIGRARDVCRQPKHPYTATLLAAATPPGRTPPWVMPLLGEVPDGLDASQGCTFAPRCPYATPGCGETPPAFTLVGEQRWVACHLRPDEVQKLRTAGTPWEIAEGLRG